MQKMIYFFCVALFVMACNNGKKETTPAEASDKPAAALPYTASYSSSFQMGDPAYAAMILQGSWKDWETNKMDNMKSWVADTATVFMSDNTMAHGVDSIAALWKRGRAGYTSVIDTINAVMPTYSIDKKENWVMVWATEISTATDGKKDTAAVMETWRINKDGKADLLLQFDRHARKK